MEANVKPGLNLNVKPVKKGRSGGVGRGHPTNTWCTKRSTGLGCCLCVCSPHGVWTPFLIQSWVRNVPCERPALSSSVFTLVFLSSCPWRNVTSQHFQLCKINQDLPPYNLTHWEIVENKSKKQIIFSVSTVLIGLDWRGQANSNPAFSKRVQCKNKYMQSVCYRVLRVFS